MYFSFDLYFESPSLVNLGLHLFQLDNSVCVCKRVCVRACDRVRVTVCVSVCVQEGLGAESGVTPAPLFKPTSQLGIRPGVWHRSRRLVSLLRAWHCFHISAAGSPFCQGFLHLRGDKTPSKPICSSGLLNTQGETFGRVCSSPSPCCFSGLYFWSSLC